MWYAARLPTEHCIHLLWLNCLLVILHACAKIIWKMNHVWPKLVWILQVWRTFNSSALSYDFAVVALMKFEGELMWWAVFHFVLLAGKLERFVWRGLGEELYKRDTPCTAFFGNWKVVNVQWVLILCVVVVVPWQKLWMTDGAPLIVG
jgi:hypothetical protein